MSYRRLLCVLAVSLLSTGQVRPPASSGRSIVVISDLHMGVGRNASGGWDPHEDFRWAVDFSAFLTAIDRDGKSTVDLVLNGDSFDLLFSLANDCRGAAGTGCSESEAVQRLARVAAAHAPELDAIRTFARTGANHVSIVPGDSDAAVLFPAVRQRLLTALGLSQDRVDISDRGYWLSRDRKVLAEHGHQMPFGAHRFDNWPAPFVGDGANRRLARPWGQQIVEHLYRRLEVSYPVVDNVAVLGTGLRWALAAESPKAQEDLNPLLLKYLLLSTLSWQQFRMELDDGDVEPPMWDLGTVRTQKGAFLLSALADDDPFKAVATRALSASTLDTLADSLTDPEVIAICDYRAAMRRARRRFEPAVSQFAPRGPAVTECVRTPDTRGALFDYFWRTRDEQFGRHIADTTKPLANQAKPEVFVYGHTHLPDRSQATANMISGGLLKIPLEGFSPARGQMRPLAINGGAWQRTVTPAQLERLLAARPLASLQPEDLPPCYSFVDIPPYSDAPEPRVRYWRQGGDGTWNAGPSCSP